MTHSADVDARRIARNLNRDQPEAQVLITGCYAQRAPQELAQIKGVRWVVGNSHKSQIADLVSNEEYHGQILIGNINAATEFKLASIREIREDRTRPNLKVQDGCSNRCSFCIIPAVRGRSRSAPLDDVVRQGRELESNYVEVVLTGINLGRWGRDLPVMQRFIDLLQSLLEHTAIRRLRISSIEPMDWNERLLELVASNPRIAQHLHIPLQSGSDSVLKRMCRKYRTRHYSTRLELAARLMPEAAIGADVMTGFPGETDAEFEETVRFVKDQPVTYLHVFSYSQRPGTAAAESSDQISASVKQERTGRLRELSEQKNLAFRQRMVGKILPSVTLEQSGIALTTNFIKVEMSQKRKPNQDVALEVGGVSATGLMERNDA